MELLRKTINLADADRSAVAPFLDAGTAEHAALESLAGERLGSDSAELRALVLLGVERVREQLLQSAYDAAVDAGDFDETRQWAAQTGTAPSPSTRPGVNSYELVRGSVWGFRYLDGDDPKPVVVVSNDGRNRSRFEWVHVIRITSRPKRPLATIVELAEEELPLTGRTMADELELVHKDDLEDRRGTLGPATMRAIDQALRRVLAL